MQKILSFLFVLVAVYGCGQNNVESLPKDSIDSVHAITFVLDTTKKGTSGKVIDGYKLPNALIIGYYNYSLYSIQDNRRGFLRDSVSLSVVDSILQTTSPDSIAMAITFPGGALESGKSSDDFRLFIKHLEALGYSRFRFETDLDIKIR